MFNDAINLPLSSLHDQRPMLIRDYAWNIIIIRIPGYKEHMWLTIINKSSAFTSVLNAVLVITRRHTVNGVGTEINASVAIPKQV